MGERLKASSRRWNDEQIECKPFIEEHKHCLLNAGTFNLYVTLILCVEHTVFSRSQLGAKTVSLFYLFSVFPLVLPYNFLINSIQPLSRGLLMERVPYYGVIL